MVGVDPSHKMIQGATAYAATQNVEGTEFEFVQSPAEDLNFLKSNSVDLVIAGELLMYPSNITKIYCQHRQHTGSTGTNYGLRSDGFSNQAVLLPSGFVLLSEITDCT